MLSLLFGLSILQQNQQHVSLGHKPDLRGTLDDGTGMFWVHGNPTDVPQLSPQKFGKPAKPWEFYYHTDAYANVNPKTGLADLRFRVFSQSAERNETFGRNAAFELLVLWSFVHSRLHLDHKQIYEGGVVDVYLCEQGEPGGEQAFEPIPGVDAQANSIYIYDVAHFNDRMEQARELAHEYGHAILPAVGGFDAKKGAEYWANGFLGEKLFLRWGRDAIAHNLEQEIGFMYAPQVMIDYWVQKHVDPLVMAAAHRPVTSPLYEAKSREAFDAYQGLVLWCDSIMPAGMFGRSMTLIGSEKAKDYIFSAVQASEEAEWSPKIPTAIAEKGSAIWIPVGTGTVTGNVSVVEKQLGWWLVKPHGQMTVHPKPENL